MTSSTALAAATASGQAGTDRETTAKRFRQRHHIRRNADALICKQVAGAAHAGLHLVEDQQQAIVVAQLTQRFEKGVRRRAYAALALQRFDQDARGVRTDCASDGFEIAERHLIEAIQRRPKTLEIFGGPGRGQRRQRAPVKRAVEGDDAIALRVAFGGVMSARDLDRAFHRLGAGVREKHQVGKARFAQPCREPLAIRTLEQVRHVPQFRRLFLQRCDQMRMGVAQRIHRDARGEIEIAFAVGRYQPRAFAALEAEIDPGEYGEQMRRRAVGHVDH
jgi:hypothetical protein